MHNLTKEQLQLKLYTNIYTQYPSEVQFLCSSPTSSTLPFAVRIFNAIVIAIVIVVVVIVA